MNPETNHSGLQRSERGVALLLTILLLLIVSAIGVSSLNRAGDELQVGSASRRQLRNVAAAEAALKVVARQLYQAQSLTAKQAPVAITNFTPEMGGNTIVRTGTIGDDGAPKNIQLVGVAKGSSVIIGDPNSKERYIYRVQVVAEDPSGGNVQLEAQFSVQAP